MVVGFEIVRQRLADPLVVSHTVVAEVALVTLRVSVNGRVGEGQVAVGPWTDEDASVVGECAAGMAAAMLAGAAEEPARGAPAAPTVAEVAAATEVGPLRAGLPTARMLAEMALLDLAGVVAGQPLWLLLGLRPPVPLRLWRTVSRGAVAGPIPGDRLKVKLGGPQDAATLELLAATARPDRAVVVDVNRGWDAADWRRLRDRVAAVRPTALEDPVADPRLLPEVRADLPGVPVLLDEGVTDLASAHESTVRADGVRRGPTAVGPHDPGCAGARRLIPSTPRPQPCPGGPVPHRSRLPEEKR
ncbi:hypothetical protein KIF24_20585 [Micromonospora sp. Llam7]|uniref:enolase C-terminal domain-like protein n=1 Tax=Micromonospora tarapacensis TaxID=2835305 RepID=UPI001C83BB35|nr:enolase C-terminal domain-like protein [Micromonospora tarapacensis]MBX7268188.1 hypothetical protein [Micromonospora tarapacensis]